MRPYTGISVTTFEKPLIIRKITDHLKVPLYFNAYAWMISTGVSSALGIVYWILAARFYSAENVGINSALISGMIFLSGVLQFDLSNFVTRFIPISGRQVYKIIGYGYALIGGASLFAGLLLISNIFPNLKLFFIPITDSYIDILFILSIIAWGVFSVQDSVLTGLRNAIWVPIENVAYAIIKLAFLVFFAANNPEDGIYLSWIIPVLFLIVPMNLLIFFSVVPKFLENYEAKEQSLGMRNLVGYIGGNYVASIFYLSSIRLLPVMVTYLSSAESGAYFFTAWTISNAIKLIVINMTKSLTVEGAFDEGKLAEISKKLAKMITVFIGPAVLLAIVAAPYILQLSGENYVLNGTGVLRVMLLAVIPSSFNLIYLSVARVEQNLQELISIQFAISAITLVGSYFALQAFGVIGVGYMILISETLVASIIIGRKTAEAYQVDWSEWMRYSAAFMQQAVSIRYTPLGLSVFGSLISILFARSIELSGMNDFGLISILPFGYYLGIMLIVIGFLIPLFQKEDNGLFYLVPIIALVVVIHGLPILTQEIPRFHVAYRHVGITEYIQRNGTVDPRINVYFNWPSFFILLALINEITGVDTSLPFAQGSYLFFNLLFVCSIYGIQRLVSKNKSKIWLTVFFYVCTSWIGQDYLAPQALGLLFYLVIIIVILAFLRSDNTFVFQWFQHPAKWFTAVSGFISLGRLTDHRVEQRPNRWQHILGLFLLIVLFSAIVPSHQLSPLFMVLGVSLLLVLGRLKQISLPVIMLTILVLWYVNFASIYFNGHLEKIISETGATNSLSAGVNSRISGSSEHLLVVRLRMILTALIFGLGSLGFLFRWKKVQLEATEIALMFFPFTLLVALTYGGEFLMRASFFSWPFMVSGMSYLFYPDRQRDLNFYARGGLVILIPIIISLVLVSKFGNERMDIHTTDELKATYFVYEIAEEKSVFVAASEETPWKFKYPEKYKYVTTIEPLLADGDIEAVVEYLGDFDGRNAYVLVLRSNFAHMEMFRNTPHAQWDDTKLALLESGHFSFLYEGPDSYVFVLNEVADQNRDTIETVKSTIDYDSLIDVYTFRDALFVE